MRFAARTGDRLIVTDPAGKEPLVIMSLDEYEALVEGALGPGDYPRSGDAGGYRVDDEYGEAPTLEIVERMVEEAAETSAPESSAQIISSPPVFTRPTPVPEIVKSEEKKIPQKAQDPSEEQFYLEPL